MCNWELLNTELYKISKWILYQLNRKNCDCWVRNLCRQLRDWAYDLGWVFPDYFSPHVIKQLSSFSNYSAWKVFLFGVFLVYIFPHSHWIQRFTSVQMLEKTDQKSSNFGHFLRNAFICLLKIRIKPSALQVVSVMYRSSRPEVICEKDVHKNFVKFTVKTCASLSLFFFFKEKRL